MNNEKQPETCVDSIPLMHQLAGMAGIPAGKFRRMVLVLDIDAPPILFTDGFINESDTPLTPTPLEVVEAAVVVDVTTLHNQNFRTYRPRQESRP
jgi:hypothetical protein